MPLGEDYELQSESLREEMGAWATDQEIAFFDVERRRELENTRPRFSGEQADGFFRCIERTSLLLPLPLFLVLLRLRA